MSNSLFGLDGKNILIIGGGQGMGESSAMMLARAGANVALVDLELARAEKVAGQVKALGRKSLARSFDVLDDKALVDGLAGIERDFAPLDGMATIVGMAGWSPVIEMSAELWDNDHRRNLRYFFMAAKTVAASMVKRKCAGSIVGITSVDGIQSAPFHASYGAAKAGLINFVRSMAGELGGHGIRVNALAPGGIVTPRIPLRESAVEAQMANPIPMGRRGTTDEIGKGVLFLLSDLASYVSGHTLAVDGGYTAVGRFDYGLALSQAKQGGTLDATKK